VYVVQTNERIIERCVMMATDPGDLVLDPTCGSGTTAEICEQWGRRWIAIDTSRVAIAIARQRVLTAKYDFYRLQDESVGVASGFRFKTIPHITLKSITQNKNLDPISTKYEAILDATLAAANEALKSVPDRVRNDLATRRPSQMLIGGAGNCRPGVKCGCSGRSRSTPIRTTPAT